MSNFEELQKYTVSDLRSMLTKLGGAPGNKSKDALIDEINKINCGQIVPTRSNRGRPSNNSRTLSVKGHETDRVLHTAVQDQGAKLSKQWDIPFEGYAEILSTGYGVIYKDINDFVGDIYVPIAFIKEHDLRTGDLVVGKCGKKSDKSPVEILSVTSVNGRGVSKERKPSLDSLAARYSDQIIYLGKGCQKGLSAIDRFCPIGKGQRTVIKRGMASNKDTLVKAMIEAIEKDNPDVHLLVSLVDERPEEVTFFRENFKSELFISTFDKAPGFKVHMADLAFMRARTLFEEGEDVVLVVDSFTRLYKAHLASVACEVGTLSQKHVDSVIGALSRYFVMARKSDKGSLTIIATVSDADAAQGHDLLVESLLDGSNQQIVLCKELLERRYFPPVSIKESNTQNLENLLGGDAISYQIDLKGRAFKGELSDIDGLELLKGDAYPFNGR